MPRLLLALSLLPAVSLAGAPPCDLASAPEGVYIATMTPGPEVHTQFGHTSLFVWDPDQGDESLFYDWGYVKLKYPDVVFDVITADQRYYMSSRTLAKTLKKYRKRGQEIALQRLDLPRETRRQIARAAVRERAKTQEERTFDYNWFHPNCGTRIRDLVDDAVGGQLAEQHAAPGTTSVAREVMRHTQGSPGAWFGLHWGCGRRARATLSQWDGMFLPGSMQQVLRTSRVADAAGTRPLVAEGCVLLPLTAERAAPEHPWRDPWLAALGAVLGLLAWAVGRGGRLGTGLVLGTVGAGLGALGSLFLAVGLFGTFAPFWSHHNQMFASPATLLLIAAGVVHWRRPGSIVATAIAAVLAGVAVAGMAVFAVEGFPDGNAGIAALVVPVLAVCAWLTWSGRRAARLR